MEETKKGNFDLVHAIYGTSGLFACIRFNKPVIVSFIGSDVNSKKIRIYSKLALWLSSYSIFVHEKLYKILSPKKDFAVISFGINLEVFSPFSKKKAKENLNLQDTKIILFASSFDNPIKNYPLAKKALELISYKGIILELGKNYSREELNLLFNSADIFLMTSLSEGSPQTIKEAMACNCPIVSTDVGDVKEIIGNTAGCFVTTYEPEDIAQKINLAFEHSRLIGRTNGREEILRFDNKIIAKNIISLYCNLLMEK